MTPDFTRSLSGTFSTMLLRNGLELGAHHVTDIYGSHIRLGWRHSGGLESANWDWLDWLDGQLIETCAEFSAQLLTIGLDVPADVLAEICQFSVT